MVYVIFDFPFAGVSVLEKDSFLAWLPIGKETQQQPFVVKVCYFVEPFL